MHNYIVNSKKDWWPHTVAEINTNIKLGNSFFLMGLAGVGSTQVLRLVEKGFGDSSKYHVDFVNCGGFLVSNDPLVNLKQYVSDLVKESPTKTKVLLLDDFEVIIEYLIKQRNDLDFLVYFLEEYKNKITFVFSVSQTPKKLLQSIPTTLSSKLLYNTVYVRPLKKDLALDFIKHLLSDYKLNGFDPDKVYKLTGGHLRLIKFVCEACKTHGATNTASCSRFIKQSERLYFVCEPILKTFTKQELDSLKNKQFEDLGFISLGVINEKAEFFSKLFEYYLIKRENDLVKENIRIYKDQKGIIYKNGDRIDTELTNYEYKLLSYMLENHNKVVSKNELAEKIWETKVNYGITDQAIDQVVLRLRKKIEDDYSKPKIIHSIKGRGYVLNNKF